jgi:uncharacterized membrane protein
MIPLVGVVSVRHWRHSRNFRLWIPLFLLWLLMLPFAMLALPVLFLVCLISRVNPFEAIVTVWHIFAALKDTHIEVNNRNALVLIRIL